MGRAAQFGFYWLPSCCLALGLPTSLMAQTGPTTGAGSGVATPELTNQFTSTVRGYEIKGDALFPKDINGTLLSKYTGKNQTAMQLATAASDLFLEYRSRGWSNISVA